MSARAAIAGGEGAGAVFLLSDYGATDEFAGIVRAVVARLAPGAPMIDLTHEVPPFDVRAGALALERAAPHLGPGVVLAVVDPGVGSERRGVALSTRSARGPRALVGPDNGLLVWAAELLGGPDGAVVLARPAGAPSTFDGRDVFAPAAAALWRGEPLSALGEPFPVSELVHLAAPRVERNPGRLEAEVLWVDRFGNVQLAATPADGRASGLLHGGAIELEAAGRVHGARLVGAFEELAGSDLPGVLVDANGRLAVVCDRRPATTVLGVQTGETVTLRLPGGGYPRGAGFDRPQP